MRMNETQELCKQLAATKLLPLYTATDLAYLNKLEEILIRNQVLLIEVTFRSCLAAETIKKLAQSNQLIVGAGTVKTLAETKLAIESGAKFIVSPAIIPEVINYCLERHTPIIPGVATPCEIQQALAYGLTTVKFFPASSYGGADGIKALTGPYPELRFLPTGGITQTNVADYLAIQQVLAVGGSFILSEKSIKKDNGQTAEKSLVELVKQINR